MFAARIDQVRDRMTETGTDAVLISVGADLPYLTGYEAMPLERLTMLVIRPGTEPELLVPKLEAPRVVERPDVFTLAAWDETENPIDWVVDRLRGATTIAVGDQMWARFLVELLPHVSDATFRRSTDIVGPVRAVKDADEIDALAAAGAAADRVAGQLQAGAIPLVGQTEAAVSADIGRRLLAEGHHKVNFAIVAAGPNAASPHHEPGETVIEEGMAVLCDFGGTMAGPGGVGYCSDTTRVVAAGSAPDTLVDAYTVLHDAQQAAVASATPGTPAAEVDRVARHALSEAGYGPYFIHRTGHGIGVEAHEDPYIVATNDEPLAPGHAFSVEPGVYVPGEWGIRLEDIVVCTDDGPLACNNSDHRLIVVDA